MDKKLNNFQQCFTMKMVKLYKWRDRTRDIVTSVV